MNKENKTAREATVVTIESELWPATTCYAPAIEMVRLWLPYTGTGMTFLFTGY